MKIENIIIVIGENNENVMKLPENCFLVSLCRLDTANLAANIA